MRGFQIFKKSRKNRKAKTELKNLSFLKKSKKSYGTIFELIVRKKNSMHRKSLIF